MSVQAQPKGLVEDLNPLLADYQVLYQKLRNYHWNVEGRHFFKLHELFEELYEETTDRVDLVAERIRALGQRPASSYGQQLEVSRLEEDEGSPDAETMVYNIAEDYVQLNEHLRAAIRRAEETEDEVTSDILHDFLDAQEKTLWMLRSFLA